DVEGGVEVRGARGRPPTDSLKVCCTYLEGFKATAVCCVGGPKSAAKGRRVADAILKRSRGLFVERGFGDFSRTHVQVLGGEDTYGPHSAPGDGPREAVLWMSVHHTERKALEVFSREVASAGTGMAPGLTSIVGGRPRATPILRLHSFLVKKEKVKPQINVGDLVKETSTGVEGCVSPDSCNLEDQPVSQVPTDLARGTNSLSALAFTRSGDKGDSCNIGVVARKEAFLPYIQDALTRDAVAAFFGHLFDQGVDPKQKVKRYEVAGIHALNFVLEECLGGGGVASLRSDPQGKALGQMILDFQVRNMPDIQSL
ncbi:UNVERIFIED_CONTAM: hypothetical protein GTU68_015243, partial [Idotea baltica]|nr:hypothetical protein [Idotea baltica]